MTQQPFGSTFRDDLAHLAGGVDTLADALTRSHESAVHEAESTHTSALTELGEHLRRKRSVEQDGIESRVTQAQRDLADAAAQIPGALGSTETAVAPTPQPVPPDGLVIGSVSGVKLPVPLASHAGLVLRGDDAAATGFLDAVFARIIATVPLSSVRVTVFDPSLRGLLGAYSELRNHSADNAFPNAYTDEYAFRQRLDLITAEVQRGAETLSARGRASVLDIWREATPTPSLHIVVVDDVPGAINDETWRNIDRISERGPACGVVLVTLQTSRGADTSYAPAGPASVVTFTDRREAVLADGDIGLAFTPLARPSHEDTQRLLREAIAAASQSQGPKVDPDILLPADGGSASSATGIDVVIGERADGKPLSVALRSENPPVPNALIGGAVGQGKSNLLAVLIYAIAAKYPPSEVEMLLLDFKEGLEFQRFTGKDGAHWLPNASVIALESDREFGVATLEHVERERQARSARFKDVGVKDYDSYRAASHALPRLMLFVDEFHVLFEGDDELSSTAVRLLDTIVRRGRAAGIHIVLATQTLSGVRSLATKLDGIFSQVPLRIALRNTASEAQTIFAPGNKAPAQLQFRGQVVVNANMGEDPDKNVFGMATFADEAFTRSLQERLWQQSQPTDPPRVFVGSANADWPADAAGGRRVLLGAAVDTAGSTIAHEFGNDPMRALAVVGSDAAVRAALTRAAIHSAVTGGAYSDVVVVGDDPMLAWASTLAAQGSATVRPVALGDAPAWLVAHEEQLRASGTLTVITDLQRIGGLEQPVGPPDPDDFLSQPETAASKLRALATDPAVEGDLVVTSANFSPLDRTFGSSRDGSDGIAAYALAGVPVTELRHLIGFDAEAPRSAPRFMYLRAGYGSDVVTGLPYETPTEGAR